jgi:type VI secretion system protein ImpL
MTYHLVVVPDQIRKQLTELYKKEYIAEWRKFLGAIHYAKAKDYGQQASLFKF